VKFTRHWIEEFIEINDSNEEIANTLNAIGHEVAQVEDIVIPKNIVVGYVKECVKHPNADKLSVAQVDIGDKTIQIVCGAKNVKKDIFVATALVGAELPNGLKIKEASLRGIESSGMICSSSEIGLPKTNDGIMILDESIGEFQIGQELCEIPLLNDTLFEIEPTANRGDVLSINGIARELISAKGYNKKHIECHINDDKAKGIGRVLQVNFKNDITADIMFKVIQTDEVKSNLLTDLRIAMVDEYYQGAIKRILKYATHETGVLLNIYDFNTFFDEEEEKACINVVLENKINKIKTKSFEDVEYLGISSNENFLVNKESKKLILEAFYLDPEELSMLVFENKIKTDEIFYRSSRGSEPDLESGICSFFKTASKNTQLVFYSEKIQYKVPPKEKTIVCRIDEINALIGKNFETMQINNILKSLNMQVQAVPEQESILVQPPQFRHDMQNSADIIEEIVRIYGIDNIKSTPLLMKEIDSFNDDFWHYQQQMELISKSVANGFFQVLNFVFTNSKNIQKYQLPKVDDKLDIINPITAELDTLRSSLIPDLLENVKRNIYKSRKKVALFEIGTVFDEKRNESKKIAFIYSGFVEDMHPYNHTKPKEIDLISFISKIKAIFPEIEFGNLQTKAAFIHPYMSAGLYIDQKLVGFISKLHPKIQKENDLPVTFIAEIDLGKIAIKNKQAKEISNRQASFRDMSIIISQDISYSNIKKEIEALNIKEIKEFYPIDFYFDKKLENNFSLSIRFILQDAKNDITEEIGSKIIEQIFKRLQKHFKASAR